MKTNWTKSDCRRLREGNPAKLRKWIRDYAEALYTWILYHHTICPSEAQERTSRVFQEAYAHLSEYNPSVSSMYRWLIGRAERIMPREKQEAGSGLLLEAPSEVLSSLGSIGFQEIPDSYLENPALIQVIQAALTDMDESERRVLLLRYHRIDQTASAESDLRFSSDLLGDHLVRARYYFRRNLLARLHPLQPRIGEFSTDSQIRVFERNLEKIFCCVPPSLKLPEPFSDDLMNVLLQQARQVPTAAGRGGLSRKSLWIAGAAVFLTAAIAICFLLRQKPPAEPIYPAGSGKTAVRSEPAEREESKQMITAEQLKIHLDRIFEAGSAGDMHELIQSLQEGPYPVQVAAAIFLGRVGDDSAIGPLEKAARRWFQDPQEENPFLTAIDQIEQRLTRQAAQEEARRWQMETRTDEHDEQPLVVIPPAEPNRSEETVEKEEIPAEEQTDSTIRAEEPNQIEQKRPEMDIQTDDVQYLEEESGETGF